MHPQQLEWRVLHPLRDKIDDHVRENERFELEPVTEAGRFHIELLKLNRAPLIAHRQRIKEIEEQTTRNKQYIRLIWTQQRIIGRLVDMLHQLDEVDPE